MRIKAGFSYIISTLYQTSQGEHAFSPEQPCWKCLFRLILLVFYYQIVLCLVFLICNKSKFTSTICLFCFAVYCLVTLKDTSLYVFFSEFGDFCIIFLYRLVLPGIPALIRSSENTALYRAANITVHKNMHQIPPSFSPHCCYFKKHQNFSSNKYGPCLSALLCWRLWVPFSTFSTLSVKTGSQVFFD